jgi:hypothetical protein
MSGILSFIYMSKHMKNRQKYIVQSEISSHRMLSLTINKVMAIIVIAITNIIQIAYNFQF